MHGSSPKAIEQPDFLSTDDPWFRPVAVYLGPDGALYVSDFYNRIIGHYEVKLDDPRRDYERGRIWRITYNGAKPAKLALDKANAKELLASLNSTNLIIRMLAMSELSDRLGKDAIEPVTALLKSGSAEKMIQNSLTRSMVAYYPFESAAPIPDDQLPRARPRNQAPKELVSQRRRGAPTPAPMVAPGAVPTAEGPKLPFDYIRSELQFSPSGLPGAKPAVLEAASLRPGLKGNAFYFTDLNRGFLPEDTGWYEAQTGSGSSKGNDSVVAS